MQPQLERVERIRAMIRQHPAAARTLANLPPAEQERWLFGAPYNELGAQADAARHAERNTEDMRLSALLSKAAETAEEEPVGLSPELMQFVARQFEKRKPVPTDRTRAEMAAPTLMHLEFLALGGSSVQLEAYQGEIHCRIQTEIAQYGVARGKYGILKIPPDFSKATLLPYQWTGTSWKSERPIECEMREPDYAPFAIV